MKLTLIREEFLPTCTIGRLFVDGQFECWTLEDTVREQTGEPVQRWKIPGKTAIPAGSYNVQVTMSQHFGKLLPLLEDVPGFSGVRIHSGNTDADTEGCILVGETKLLNSIGNSRIAFSRLFEKIQRVSDRRIQSVANRDEVITLTIEGEPT